MLLLRIKYFHEQLSIKHWASFSLNMADQVDQIPANEDTEQSVYADAPEKSSESDEKREAIQQACQQRDVGALVQLATSSGGLLDDELRRSACMSSPE